MDMHGLYGKIAAKLQPSSPADNLDPQVYLGADEAKQIKPHYQILRIVEGSAWLSYRGEDVVLREGDEMPLKWDRFSVVISPLGNTPLVYEVLEAA